MTLIRHTSTALLFNIILITVTLLSFSACTEDLSHRIYELKTFTLGNFRDSTLFRTDITIIPNLKDTLDIKYASQNDYFARVAQITTPHRESMRERIYADIENTTENTSIYVTFYYVESIGDIAYYQSAPLDGRGKAILFSDNPDLNGEFEYAYVLYALPQNSFRLMMPRSQFAP